MHFSKTKVPFTELAKVTLVGKQSILFFIATILSFGFSISVILSTVGLMDGFEQTLLAGLQKSSGDIKLLNRNGFFTDKKIIQTVLKHADIKSYSEILQSEGFFMNDNRSKGVVLKGVNAKDFNNVTGLKIQLAPGEMAIGKELAEQMLLKKGDSAVIAFGKGNQGIKSLPLIKRIKISSVVEHGIYEKDLRFVYLPLGDLQNYLSLEDKFNIVFLSLKNSQMKEVENTVSKLREIIDFPLVVRPSWDEFGTFLDAVEIEKISITIVLQLIVIVSIFNIAAFIIFISERKSQDFFLFRALGMNTGGLVKFWTIMTFIIWSGACAFSLLLTFIFDNFVLKLPFLQIPGKIYVLGALSLSLDWKDYLIVFSLSLVWVILITLYGILRLKKKSILYGLRKEFA